MIPTAPQRAEKKAATLGNFFPLRLSLRHGAAASCAHSTRTPRALSRPRVRTAEPDATGLVIDITLMS